jgi:hypothetical protein
MMILGRWLMFGSVKCPECDGKLEESESVCPHCGHEIAWNENKENNSTGEDLVGGIIGIVVVLVVAVLAVNLIKYALG